MRSRFALVIGVVAAGCTLEHGNPPPDRAAGASEHAARDTAGAMHGVFDRRVDTVAPGVVRMTVRVVVRGEGGREGAKNAMEAVASAVRSDTSLVAVRVLGYLPPAAGHGEQGASGLIPFAYLDWVPAGGWDSLSARTAHGPHHVDVVFVQDLGMHPGTGGNGTRGRPQ